MRVIVCGGRNYLDRKRLWGVLDAIHAVRRIRTVVHGAARGADQAAAEWARQPLVDGEAHPADWDAQGRIAGHVRNDEMARAGADLCIAFPGGRGTASMALKAKAQGIPVLDLREVS